MTRQEYTSVNESSREAGSFPSTESTGSLPRISLVTCSYQQVRFLGAAMQSVLRQGYPNLEYIVIDGASDDGSVAVIREHSGQLNHWVSERDEGQTEALIKGFSHASGEIFGWLCSDDLLLPGALATVGRFFQQHPEVDFVYGDSVWIDVDGHPIRPKKEMGWNRFVSLFDHNYLPQPSCFWRKNLYTRVGGLGSQWNLSMDADLWMKFTTLCEPVHLNHYLSCMRMYPQQKTRALRPTALKELRAIRMIHAPATAAWPSVLTYPVARAARIGLKLVAGGYTASIPESIAPWLASLATPNRVR